MFDYGTDYLQRAVRTIEGRGSWSKAYVILPRNFSGRMTKLMRKSQDSRSAG